jgi:hypothetical protein
LEEAKVGAKQKLLLRNYFAFVNLIKSAGYMLSKAIMMKGA